MAELQGESVSFLRTIMWGVAGILSISALLGSISATGGYASPFVLIMVLGLVVLITIPVLEYTRLAKFAGGYYGAAELGFGKATGKFVALTNYFFYLGSQVAIAAFVGSIVAVGYYAVYNTYPPIYVYFLSGILLLTIPLIISTMHVKRVSAIVTYMTIVGFVLNIVAFGLLISHAHYFSLQQFNPAFAPGGLKGALFSMVVYGFFVYAGYGFLLFYSEEGKQPFKNTWRAAIIAMGISAVLWVMMSYAVNAVFGPVHILTAIVFPQPGLLLYVKWLGPAGELFIVGFLVLLVTFSFASCIGAQARVVYTLSRDNFIKNKWVGRLNRNQVPANSMFLNFVISLAAFLSMGAILVPAYGYFSAIFYMSYVSSTIVTVFWYFHHIIPDLSLSAFFRRHRISLLKPRAFVISLLIPLVSAGLIIYSVYETIIIDMVEPFFAAIVVSLLITVGIMVWVAYRHFTGTIGISSVEARLNDEALAKMGGVVGGESGITSKVADQ